MDLGKASSFVVSDGWVAVEGRAPHIFLLPLAPATPERGGGGVFWLSEIPCTDSHCVFCLCWFVPSPPVRPPSFSDKVSSTVVSMWDRIKNLFSR